MKFAVASLALAAGLVASISALAQAPAAAQAGSTGLCKDGSYTSHDTKKGACSGHKGVKDWYGGAPASATAPAPATAPVATAAASKPLAPAAAPTKTAAAPAAGGGPGQVWVNSGTKVYHCPGAKYYGKTKQGEYMTEAAAKAAGNHANHGKACS
ncbi:DUF3761 domain-containing protein [Methylibium sp.]|uniref:DUF3761 domain-containing protein n=1 Tax=Methylibium sp. TaxID=2067992 RepID=UPI003D10A5BC